MLKNKVISSILIGTLAFSTVTPLSTTDCADSLQQGSIEICDTGNKGQLDSIQLNSITMLNYLTYVSQKIIASSNSRIYLEETYSELLNNILQSKINPTTQSFLNELLDTIESYRMLDVKRERLRYVYEQNKTDALVSAIPDPISVLSVATSGDKYKAIVSALYLAVDSVTSYQRTVGGAGMQFLQDGWQLDDEASAALHNIRLQSFNYITDMVRDNNFSATYALNENSVQDFVAYENNSNITSRLQFFEDNEDTYRYFGPYWLARAKCYYELEDYEACLDAFDSYKTYSSEIFRKDCEYAKALPMAITAAKYVKDEDEYITYASRCANLIVSNSNPSDWDLRYSAALTYMELYQITNDNSYLQIAYNTIKTNVNTLVQDQLRYNEAYVSEFEERVAPDGATDQMEDDVDDYNDYMEELRKTQLSPLYRPLALNCDLIWKLADELNISAAERNRINQIINGNSIPCFFNGTVANNFTFNGGNSDVAHTAITLSKGISGVKLIIPATVLSENSTVELVIRDNNRQTYINDWSVKKVKRNTEGDINSFEVTYISDWADDYNFVDGSIATLIITTQAGNARLEERFYFYISVTSYFGGIQKDVDIIQTFN